MQRIDQSDVPWTEQRSPNGRYHIFRRHLSEALGAPRDAGVAGGGHPFDVEMARLPPGATNFPLHAHAGQWEVYIILSGEGELRAGETLTKLAAGSVAVCPPGEPHQIRNTGEVDLAYYVVADNPPADVIHYPNTGKWFVKPQRKVFRMEEVDYYEAGD